MLLYRSFIATIPRDLDEAAIIDGAKPLQIFFKVILPLLCPVTVTLIVVQSIAIFNDFTNPPYYLPGKENVTVQLTLFNFQSQCVSAFNLLFMNILLVTILPLIVFIVFNRQIVAGMTAGAVKGQAMADVKLNDIRKCFGAVKVIKGIDLDIKAGEPWIGGREVMRAEPGERGIAMGSSPARLIPI